VGPSAGGCLYQVLWSILGPGLVVVAGSVGILRGLPLGSAPDWFLLGAVILSVAARWLDPTPAREPGPGEGRPPSRGTYAAWIVGAGAVLFAVAHFVVPRVS
jgi:hypothetical protein